MSISTIATIVAAICSIGTLMASIWSIKFKLIASIDKDSAVSEYRSMISTISIIWRCLLLTVFSLLLLRAALLGEELTRGSVVAVMLTGIGLVFIVISLVLDKVMMIIKAHIKLTAGIIETQNKQLAMMKKALDASGEKGDG